MNELLLTLWPLLCAGHLLADFLLQSGTMVERKRTQWPWMAAHGLEVLLVQGLVLFPFVPGARTVQALAAIAASHVCIDVLKVRLETWAGRRLAWFVLDQLLHFLVLALAAHWLALAAPAIERHGFSPHGLRSLAWIAGLYAFNVNGSSAIVSAVLEGVRAGAPPLEGARAGRVIGILERMAMLTLVWMGEWSALGFVLAASRWRASRSSRTVSSPRPTWSGR